MTHERFDRQIALFGEEGQKKLRAARVAIVGAGGTGSVVIPELALLGIGSMAIIDHDELEETNRNRHFCARVGDPIPGTKKVDIGARMALEYDSATKITLIPHSVLTPEGFAAVRNADFVFGCVDGEGIRLVLTELCAAYAKPYIDIATGVSPEPPISYGGTVCCAIAGQGCLVCMRELDLAEAAQELASPGQRKDHERIYGVDRAHLRGRGPSIVSVNAVAASLAITEFMKLCTGIGIPARLLKYRGESGVVATSRDTPSPNCYYCKHIYGSEGGADVERYIKALPPPTEQSKPAPVETLLDVAS